jgi:Dolichyl-phosphate-mannose-protein mannosyltransferase
MADQIKRLLCSPLFITISAFVARMVVLIYSWQVTPIPVRYFLSYGYELGHVARAIAAGQGFSSPLRFVETGPTIWFTPIYPYLVAGIFKIWGIYTNASKLVIMMLNCTFATLTIIPIYSSAERTFGKNVAVGASWAWVFLPTALFFPITWIWDTAMAALFLALIFWATLVVRDKKTVLPWVGYGALWATGVLVNPSLLSLLPFLAGWAIWQARKDSAPWPKFAAATLLVFALGLVPWTVRNYRVLGKAVVLRSNFGLELWLGNNPNVPDTWAPWMHPNDNMEEAIKYKNMGEIAYMAEKQHEAFVFMRTHPADTLNFMYRRFVENWLAISDSPLDFWGHTPLYIKVFFILNVLLSLSTFLGVMFAYRFRHPQAFPYAMVPLIFPIIFYVTHSSLRYRFPMDPIMMILATYGVSRMIALVRGKSAHLAEEAASTASLPIA